MLLQQRKQLNCGKCLTGSAQFKSCVETIYKGARANYDQAALSSGEFSLASARDDQDIQVIVASEIRGLEELFCHVITDHRRWAVKRIIASQRDKTLRKQLPEVASSLSVRSKNFARLVALGDEQEAQKA